MSSHIVPVKTYAAIFASLLALTGLTVAVSFVELGEWNVIIALLIALAKASLVAWVFMNVRYSTTLTRLFVIAGVLWLAIMLLMTFSDYATRSWTYQGQPWGH